MLSKNGVAAFRVRGAFVFILLHPSRRIFIASTALVLFLAPAFCRAGGPKYVAGPTFFNPAVLGQPVHWSGGQVNYYVDRGPLSGTVTNQQATAMVDAAASIWSAVPTAGVTLTDKGPLNEDVSGASIQVDSSGQITAPSDVTPSATTYPLGIVYDADGSVIDAVFGATTSQPDTCQDNGVFVWMDSLNPDATIAHAIILLNGRCATNAAMLEMMSYEIERAFGRVLGLDYSQVNPGALQNGEPGGTAGWPIMQPLSGVCGASGGACIPNPNQIRYDDIAALNRIYPITTANLSSFPGKQITAANTISIQGTVAFRTGYGMQGVNVVARPLDSDGNPLYQYTVTAVTGALFGGNHGNPITGYLDAEGVPFSQWGSTEATLQGAFDLSGIPLPPGATTANYQLTFESLNPLYILTDSVGPYVAGQVSPSGALQTISLPNMQAGSSQTITVTAANSAAGGEEDAIGAVTAPRPMPASGMWYGGLSQIGQTDWFTFPVRGNRTFTVVTQALDETGSPTNNKAMPTIGVWDAFDPAGATAVGSAPGLNGMATGETWLRVSSSANDIVRIGIADLRGDGRPDYAYTGWVLYADTVEPQRLSASGGSIVIHGMGFHLTDTVLVGGQQALVTSISPNEITAIAPPAAAGVMGSVDVEIDDQPIFYAAAILSGGISYDAATGDALTILSAPSGTIPIGTPVPFSVMALAPNLTPAGGVTVIYTVTTGTAILACGKSVCSVTSTGDGRATMNVYAIDATWSTITASLTNGSSLEAQFMGGVAPTLTALNPQLSLAAGATFTWTVQALVLKNGTPQAGQSVAWQATGSGVVSQSSAPVVTNSSGIATQTLTAGPLTEGQIGTINACLNGASQCVTFTALGARPELAALEAVSGITQSIAVSAAPSQIVLRLLDTDGNPMAGGTVALYQALYAWSPHCSAHELCAPGPLLATQASTAISAIDGTVVFNAATLPGVATNLQALAASGNSATVSIAVEQHP
jgi:hypothetical protein